MLDGEVLEHTAPSFVDSFVTASSIIIAASAASAVDAIANTNRHIRHGSISRTPAFAYYHYTQFQFFLLREICNL